MMEIFFRLYIGLDKYKIVIISLAVIGSFFYGFSIYRCIYGLKIPVSLSYTVGLYAIDIKTPKEIEYIMTNENQFSDDKLLNRRLNQLKKEKVWEDVYIASLWAKFTVVLTIILLFIRRILRRIYRRLVLARGGHTIVVGLGRNSRFFIDSMLEKFPHKLIAFETDKENSYLSKYKNKQVSIVVEDVEKMMDGLNLDEVKNIFISTGNDRKNIYYALLFLERLKNNSQFGKLLLHIADRTLRNLYSDKGTLDSHSIDMNVFSFSKESARILFWKYPLDGSDDKLIKSSEPFTINIIGEDELSVSLAIEASKLAHYPNGNHLYINIIAKETTPIKNKIEFAFPEMCKIKNIHISYKKIDDTKIDFYKPTADIWNAINLKHVFFCYDDITRNISISTKVFNYTFLRRRADAKEIKFHIATLNHPRIAKRLESSSPKNLSIFAKAEEVCSYKNLLDNDIDTLAKAIHYDYYLESLTQMDSIESEDEQWKKTLINDKKSSVGQAIHISTKLKYLGLTIEQDRRGLSVERLEELNNELLYKILEIRKINNEMVLDKLVNCEHNRWMALLKLMDYQYADIPKKDKIERLHPFIKPFSAFSEEEKEMYIIYNTNAILRIANYQARLGNILKIK